MATRRVMIAMAIVLVAGAVVLLVAGQPVLALIVGLVGVAQVVAAYTTSSGRTVVTVLFTDIVDSTRAITASGDAEWQKTFDRYADVVRRRLSRAHAAFVKDLGDGFMAVFPIVAATPGRVVEAAVRMADEAAAGGLVTRTGIHTGECALSRSDARGLAVHTAARLVDAAEPGTVVISGALRELLGGTDLCVVPLGERQLKGLDEPVRLYGVHAQRAPRS